MQAVKGSLSERVAIVLLCFGYLIFASFYSVVSGLRDFEYTDYAVFDMLLLEITFGIAALFLLRRRGWTRADIPVTPSMRGTVIGIVLAVLALLACAGAYLLLARTDALRGWSEIKVNLVATPALMLLFLVVNSVYEELFVTGYLIEAARPSGLAFAVSLSTAVRLLYHTYQGPVAFSSIVPIGLLFGAYYARRRNLWPPVVAHTIINVYSWIAAT